LIRTDQPVYKGGEGTAPAPFDLFLASIATCAGIYIVSFCQNRKIPIEDASLVMRQEKDPETKMITRILIEIILPESFPAKYTNAVVKAVNSCAVKMHMQNPPQFLVEPRIGS
jgi:ribosomal protein S12 methylthiotransferase accessory factor